MLRDRCLYGTHLNYLNKDYSCIESASHLVSQLPLIFSSKHALKNRRTKLNKNKAIKFDNLIFFQITDKHLSRNHPDNLEQINIVEDMVIISPAQSHFI